MIKSNVLEIIKELEQKKENILNKELFSDAFIASLNVGLGLLKRRIFNLKQDANGFSLGNYKSLPYTLERIEKGRQVETKDLEFTGSLRKSIEVVKIDGGKVVIIITNKDNADIANWQEIQIGKLRGGERAEIFILSAAEYETVKVQAERLIKQILDVI